MNLLELNVYFPLEYRGKAKKGAYIHIFPVTTIPENFCELYYKEKCKTFDDFFPYTNTEESPEYVRIAVDLSDDPEKNHEDILARFTLALNGIPGIKKVIVNSLPYTDDDSDDFDNMDEYDDENWDQFLGIDKLSLNFPAHAVGFEGECFNYSVYFTETPGKEQVELIEKAIHDFNFKLTGDDYIGYVNVGCEAGVVVIYFDLGNTVPENENKILHGILLAINDVPGIEKVIVNEGC